MTGAKKISLCVLFGVLLWSVLLSGLRYQLDTDEVSHVQAAYLMLKGYIPYTQFFMTYTPIFHFFIAPIMLFTGFTTHALDVLRLCMALLFLLRLALSVWLVTKLFTGRIAALFAFLFLLDPFTVFSAMQIRPDNLMMTIYTAGLVLLWYGLASGKPRWILLSGSMLSTSGLVMLKIIPGLAVVGLLLVGYAIAKRRVGHLLLFAEGVMIPILLLVGYTLFAGSTTAMIHQVFTDALAINGALVFPVPVGNFYLPDNIYVFGVMGRPLSWVFAWMLPIMAGIGAYSTVSEKGGKGTTSWAMRAIQMMCIGVMVVQWVGLLTVRSVFLQYYLPLSWLMAVFAAVCVDRIVFFAYSSRMMRTAAISGFGLCMIIFVRSSVQANVNRSTIDNTAVYKALVNDWTRIPEGAMAYPNILFRPLAYPLTNGYYFLNLPPSIVGELPPLTATLEKHHVKYILDTYEVSKLPADFQFYLVDTYTLRPDGVYIRK